MIIRIFWNRLRVGPFLPASQIFRGREKIKPKCQPYQFEFDYTETKSNKDFSKWKGEQNPQLPSGFNENNLNTSRFHKKYEIPRNVYKLFNTASIYVAICAIAASLFTGVLEK